MDFQMHAIKANDFIDYVLSHTPQMKEPKVRKNNLNNYIILSEFQKFCIVETFNHMFQCGNSEMAQDAQNLFNDILCSKNRGKIYEALAYSFLREIQIPFSSHFQAPESSSLKTSRSYIGDGKITFGFSDENEDELSSIYFEVKSLGIGEPMLEKLKEQLARLLPDYYILVQGSLDASTKEMEKEALSKINEICQKLRENKRFDETLSYSLPSVNINITAIPYEKLRREMVYVGDVSTFNPYKWAEKNETYFFKHFSQLCKDRPFLIICPFDECVSHTFTGGFADIISIAFRSLARRMFMGLRRSKCKLRKYDGKADDNVKVSEAVDLISGIVFLNVNKPHDTKGTSVWIYINPNAKNPIPSYQLDQLTDFRSNPSVIFDDFMFDNY